MAAVAYLGLKGNIKDVVARLRSMTDDEYTGLKTSALSAAAKRQEGAK